MSSTKSKVPPYLSRKMIVTSMVAMICVVFIHLYNYTDTYLRPFTRISEGIHIGAILQFFISNGITRFVIPLFFVILGYLLFSGLKK